MLVQELDDRLRLIRQQDHAQISGALAAAWLDPDGELLPYRLVWATGVHDAAWTRLDRRPILDSGSARPYDFHRLPLPRKLDPYRRGIAEVADLDPYAGLQVSRHYCSFLDADSGGDDVVAFVERERGRQADLLRRLPGRLRGDGLLDRELAYLKLFDTLSLYLCLSGPGVGPETRPEWLVPEDEAETPSGRRVELSWRSEDELALDPAPLRSDLELLIPYRELAARHGSQEELEESWREAETRHREVRVSSDR